MEQRWSIPWLAHTYVLCYRRDLLKQVGVDEAWAFDTIPHMAETLQRLCDGGIELPWVTHTSTDYSRDHVHMMASWVWGSGGRFLSPDGKRMLLRSPEARAGIKAYFNLFRYLPPSAHHLSGTDSVAAFTQGRAAITILSAPNLYVFFRSRSNELAAEVRDNLGTTVLPGVPYVGGSNLVIWKHTPSNKAALALKLVRFLTGRRAQALFAQRSGIPPGRLEAIADTFFVEEPFKAIVTALQTGRSYRSLERWGVVEDKLAPALVEIQSEVMANPTNDLDAIIFRHLDPVAEKLDLILGN